MVVRIDAKHTRYAHMAIVETEALHINRVLFVMRTSFLFKFTPYPCVQYSVAARPAIRHYAVMLIHTDLLSK
jgi:hypothetical protein